MKHNRYAELIFHKIWVFHFKGRSVVWTLDPVAVKGVHMCLKKGDLLVGSVV